MTQVSRFEALDSWRGICALFVVLFHVASMLASSLDSSLFIRNAYLFVDFFFVLSGFVLCHGYRGEIAAPVDIYRFALRRFARVWPLHVIVLAAFVLAIVTIGRYPHPDGLTLSWSGGDYALNALMPSLLLLNAVGLQANVWNGPAWSIGAEFYVYLLFALVLIVAPRRLVPAAVGLSVAALAVIWWMAPDLMNSTWDYGAIRCVAGFFAGVVAYHVHERLARISFLKATLYELAVIALVVVFVLVAGNGPDDVFVTSLAAPLVFAAAVVVFAGEGGLMSLTLRGRPFRALGRYSFSIYMIHQPLLIMLCYGLWRSGVSTKLFAGPAANGPMPSSDLLVIDFVLAVILLAAASHRYVEKPARDGINVLAPRAAAAFLAARGRLVASRSRGRLAEVTVSARRGR